MCDADLPGQYPKRGRKKALEAESKVAFQRALPSDIFLYRDEAGEDQGVDASIELLAKGESLNVRAQVQLKSTDSEASNRDGSISVSVSVSSFNALLNGPSALYVLHINPKDELRFAWAWEIRRNLDQESPGWEDERSISIKFHNVLDLEAVKEIWRRVLRDGKLHRSTQEAIASASGFERVSLSIDVETLDVMTGTEAVKTLEEGGLSLVSRGDANAAMRLVSRIDYGQADRSKVQLVAGYACASLGRYIEALGHLSRARLRRGELSGDEPAFLDYLIDACRMNSGQLSSTEFTTRQQVAAGLGGSTFAMSLRLDAARQASYSGTAEALYRLREVSTEIANSGEAGTTHGFHANMVLLQLEGRELAAEVIERTSLFKSRLATGMVFDPEDEMTEILDAIEVWETKMAPMMSDPRLKLNRGFLADALTTRALVRFLYMSGIAAFADGAPPESVLSTVYDIQAARTMYLALKDFEGELRSAMLLSNFFELVGRVDDARTIAKEVLPKAEAVGYQAMQESATDVLEGRSMIARARQAHERLTSTDQDFMIEAESDDRIENLSLHLLATSRLPADRLPNLRDEAYGIREEARTKVRWCRHLDLLQHLAHTQSRATAYRDSLLWSCRCEARNIRPQKDTRGFEQAIRDFKEEYCTNCSLRSPKLDASEC